MSKIAKLNSAVVSQPCPSGHITTDKKLRYASPLPAAGKLPSCLHAKTHRQAVTSFICKILFVIVSNIKFKVITKMSLSLFQKKIFFLFLFLLCMFCFPVLSLADMLAAGYSSHSIDFTPSYVFIATDYGINIYDKKSKKWEAIPLEIQEKNIILGTKPTCYPPTNSFLVVRVFGNKVWFGSYGNGAYEYNLRTGELIHYEGYHMVYNNSTRKEEVVGNCELSDNVVNSIVVDKRNNIWFATNCGVSKLTNGSWENFLSNRSYASRKQKATFGGNITCLELDREGYLWIGRSDFHYAYYDASPPEMIVDGGISVFNGEKWVHYYAKSYDLENPDQSHIKTDLISNDVRCLAIDNDEVYIGTSKGMSVFNKKTKKWESYTTENSGIISNNITSITIGDGFIWIATNSGISKYDKINKKWTNYGSDVLPALNIKSIKYDIYDKSIWAITSLCAYVDIYVYHFDGNRWTIFPTRKRLYPKNAQELLNLGIFLKERGVKEEAITVFAEICKKYPKSEENIRAKYEILTMEKVDLNTLMEFKKKYHKSPYAIKIQFEIAKYYEAQGDYQRAIEEYREFIRESQNLEEIYNAKLNIAHCYKRLKNYQEEINAWQDLYDNFYGVNEIFRQRTEYIPCTIAEIYMNQLKDYRNAIEWFETYLQKQKGDSPDETILKIGSCYENLKEYGKAIESYERIKYGSWKFEEAQKRIIEIENRFGISKEYPIKNIQLDSFNSNIVWFVSDAIIWKYDKNSKNSLNFGPQNGILSLIEKFFVTKKYAWAKTKKGIIRIDKTTNEIKCFDYLGDIAYDGQNVWMINSSDKKEQTFSVIKFYEMENTLEEFMLDSIKLPRNYNYKIILDGKYVWIYGGKYLAGYNKEKDTWDKYGQVKDYFLKFLACDQNFLWFDTDDVIGGSVGIYRFDKNTQEWKLFPRIYAERIIPTKKYNWFIGIAPNLVRYDKSLDEFKTFTPQKWSWPKDFIIVGEALWIISNDGAYILDENTGDWREKYPAPRNFPYKEFRFLTIKDESVWFIYVEYSYELYRFDTKSKNWYKFTLPLSNIQNLTIDTECAWLISNNKIFKYDLDTKNVEEITLTTH